MARSVRRHVLALLLAALSVSSLIFGATGSHQGSGSYVYMNVNQEVVEPGQDASVTIYGSDSSVRFQVRRLDPIRFSENASLDATTQTIRDETVTLGDGGYNHQTSVTLSNLAPGLYAVTAQGSGTEVASNVLQVSRVGLVARQGQTRSLLWAVRLATGEPIADAPIYQGGQLLGRTGDDGTATSRDLKKPLVLVAPDGVAALASYPYYSDWDAQRLSIYTDRPLYRPGQTAHVKLVAWERDGDGFRAPPPETVAVRISHYENDREVIVGRSELRTNSYGSAWMDVVVPEAGLGYYNIQVTWRERTFYGSFQVEEYRLPKFRVDVSPSEARLAAGESADFLIAARYFYGEPVTQGKVHYRLEGSPWYANPCYWCDYRYPYGSTTPSSAPPQEGDLELGPDGTARLHLQLQSAGQWRLEAQVTALNGERIDGGALLDVQPSSRLIEIDWQEWFVPVNSTKSVPLLLTDLDGDAVDGALKVSLWHRTWDSSYAEQRVQVGSQDLQTSGGKATYPVRVSQPGSYEIEVSTTDPQGREATAHRWFWSSSDDYSWYGGRDLELIPEATDYRVGETMRFHVSSQTRAPVLVSLEAGDPIEAKLVDLDRRSSVEFVAPPVRGPRVEAVALQVTPGSGFLPSVGERRVQIEITPRAESLQIEVVSDKGVYEDGETARLLIRVRDSQGRPVRAELSLAMVDEALFALNNGTGVSLVDTFYEYPGYISTRASWQGQYWSNLRFTATAGGAGGATAATTGTAAMLADSMDAESSPPPSIKVREFFPETALWLPRVETDALGLARVEAVLPDQLTTWRLTAIGITGNGQAGEDLAQLVTRRELVADLYAPRFLTQYDESTIQATISNYLGTRQDVRVLLNVTGLELLSPATRTLTLSHAQSELVSFRVRAAEPGEAVLTLYAWTGDTTGDAVRIRLPVQPHGVHEVETRAGRNAANLTLTIPASTVKGASLLNITLSPTIADAMVDALPFLTGYPYGCVEQTLSRFMPDIAVARTARSLGLNASTIDPHLDDQVAKGLERLYSFQHASGGWGWWSSDGDNPYTTSYVVYGLDLARDAGYPVREDVLQRGVDALAEMARDEPIGTLRAYQLYALSQVDPKLVTEIPSGQSTAELALAALIADAKGDADAARSKAAQLRAQASRSADLVHWDESEEGWGPYGISSDGMLTALALRALVAIDPDDADATGAAVWLLNQRRGAAWYTTKETAEVILSLADYFEATGELDADFTATVTVDGVAHTRRFNESNLFQPRAPIEIPVEPGPHQVSFARSGHGTLYWSAASHFWREDEPIRADNGPFQVKRTIVDEEGRSVSRLAVGQEATVRLEVSARDEDHQYVMIEDPLPAGVEVLREESPYYMYGWGHGGGMSICYWCGYWSGAEVHDDRVGFFAWWLPQSPGTAPSATTGSRAPDASGPIQFEYRIRAVFPGTYHVMPPRAEEMYDPSVQGHGAESALTVEAPPSLQVGRVRVDADRVLAQVFPVGGAGKALTASVVTPEGEHSHETFERSADGTWTVDLAAPTTGDFQLVLRAGAAGATKHIQRVAVQIPPIVPFNATEESAWDAGPVVSVGRVLAEQLAPDYAALFRNVPPDPLLQASPTVSIDRRWWPFIVFGIAGLAAASLIVIHRATRGEEPPSPSDPASPRPARRRPGPVPRIPPGSKGASSSAHTPRRRKR